MASRLNGGDPMAAWHEGEGGPSRRRPARARRAAAARRSSQDFIQRQRIVTIPRGRAGRRAADAAVLPLDVRQHVDARAVRDAGRCARSTTSPTSIRRGRPSARTSTCATSTTARSGRSRSTRSSPATSCTTSTCARSTSKLRKSILFSSTAFVEGWAHYCEQMMIDEGFRKSGPGRPARPARRSADSPRAASSSASGCTARTCRSSRASASSATRRSSRRSAPAAKRSAARSIRPTSCTRPAS